MGLYIGMSFMSVIEIFLLILRLTGVLADSCKEDGTNKSDIG